MTGIARGEAPHWLDVSRETLNLLDALLSLVEKWNPAINLVAAGSLNDAWNRHVLDSAQLYAFIPAEAGAVADFGSGAGFPGLVLAIIAKAVRPELNVTLIESDRRKAAFLAQAARNLGLTTRVLTDRAETLPPLSADVISARAFAPMPDLCALAHRHLAPDGVAIFPKGAKAEAELAEAARTWRFDCAQSPSKTDPAGRIITLKSLHHA